MLILLLTLCVFNSALGQENPNDDEADPRCANFLPVVTDYTEAECKKKGPEWYLMKKDSCFPTCEYYKFDDYSAVQCEKDSDCVPGYLCEDYCFLDDTCLVYYAYASDNDYYKTFWKPACSEDAQWAAKQCKGEVTSGRCFCFDEKGKRLFGQAWINEAENMTCSCSRRKDALRKNETVWYTTLHCDATGNYEVLQCEDGICWCADPKTGQPTTTVVPEVTMKKLPCFHTVDAGGQYLRQCDSQQYAEKYIDHLFKQHGTNYANFPTLLCDDDGRYGPYKIDNGAAYCTWRDNSFIPNYQSPVGLDTNNLTCNCARDKKLYASMGKTLTQLCLNTGEYSPSQNTETPGLYYCVDKDGYRNALDFTTDENACKNQKQ